MIDSAVVALAGTFDQGQARFDGGPGPFLDGPLRIPPQLDQLLTSNMQTKLMTQKPPAFDMR